VTTIVNGWDGQPLARKRGDRPPRAICIAHFRPEKGHEFLIAAWTEVSRVLPPATLRLVGDGPERARIEDAIDAAGLWNSVELTGPAEDVWPLLAESDLLVLPSRSESLGIVALEAMAAGLPVVATAVGGLRDLVQPGRNGALAAPDDPRQFAHAVIDLLRDPRKRESMAEACRATAALHTKDAMVAEYFALYDELLSMRAAG
jgi:glycosyltransferase involved in cell wall biosynthesis